MKKPDPLLDVKNLHTYFYSEDGVVKAVDGVSFKVYPGEILGLVGESGCGKSITSLSIMRLVGIPGKIISGEILLDGIDLIKLPEEKMVEIRGNRISMIFQQPQSSLNPVFTAGDQIAEVLEIHQKLPKVKAREYAIELMRLVGIPDPVKKAYAYPHEMSGGQAQRVMIAMGLAMNPRLLIADEPTTALDVTIQAQILDLMLDLRKKTGSSIILITHDLGVISDMADRVAVMYAGQMMEQCKVDALFTKPLHPYTLGLINSIPILGKVLGRLEVIPGHVPNLIDLPTGCRFSPRCHLRYQYKMDICEKENPSFVEVSPGHHVRCWLYQSTDSHNAPIQFV